MTQLSDALSFYRQQVELARGRLSAPHLNWLNESREQALDTFTRLGFPQRTHENWRYTSIDNLLKHHFIPVTEEFTALQDIDVADHFFEQEAYRLTVANGRVVPSLSELDDLPAGVTLCGLNYALQHHPDWVKAHLAKICPANQHAFSALNNALINDGVFLRVGPGVVLPKPIEIVYLTLGLETEIMVQPRNLVLVEKGAQATLIEQHVSTGNSVYFNNLVTEIFIAEDAQFTHYSLQQESPNAFHLSGRGVLLAQNSRYFLREFSLGGCWGRVDLKVEFAEPYAHADLGGLYLVGDQQLQDVHLNILHNAPGGRSLETYRGLLCGKGRAVFDGKIRVERAAQKTDAALSNANWLLSRDAEVDTKPQLEIFADDVKCSHGTTVGQIDPQQLFYLRSRGIPHALAKQILCLGFAQGLLEGCKLEAVRIRTNALIQQRLIEFT